MAGIFLVLGATITTTDPLLAQATGVAAVKMDFDRTACFNSALVLVNSTWAAFLTVGKLNYPALLPAWLLIG